MSDGLDMTSSVKKVTRGIGKRPAESGSLVVGAVVWFVARFVPGLTAMDIAQLTILVAAAPMGITWLVDTLRSSRP